MTLSELLESEVTDFIKMKVSADLGIKPDTQVNANDVITKIESLPFVDLGQMDDARYKIDSYEDEDIEEDYPEIAEALRDPRQKGYVASAMWDVFIDKDHSYELDDEIEGDSNFASLLNDVNDYLKD